MATNQANARIRRGSATVRITTPVSAPPAANTRGVKRDIALVYPIPVMVNGRPT